MSYALRADRSLTYNVRHIASNQLGKAITVLATDPSAAGVHEARKRCKQTRGLLRLVKPGLHNDHKSISTSVRDAARELSATRDAGVLGATFDALIAASDSSNEVGATALGAGLRAQVEQAQRRLANDDEAIGRAVSRLRMARQLVSEVEVNAASDTEVIRSALHDVYASAQRTLRGSLNETGDAKGNWHEWRKEVKALWYSMRLLRDTAPALLRGYEGSLGDLAERLGDDHDLAVLIALLQSCPDEFGTHSEVELVIDLAAGRRRLLQRQAIAVGRILLAEKPSCLARRVAAYYDLRRKPMSEHPVLAPDVLATIAM